MKETTVIIGAGIIGLAIAVTLCREGVDVLLVEAEEAPCRGASRGNAGHIATEQVYPVADAAMLREIPKMLLDPLGPLRIDWRYLPRLLPWALKTAANLRAAPYAKSHAALLAINNHSLNAWRAFAKHWQLEDLLHVEGSLLTCEKTTTANKLRAHGATLNALGIPSHYLDARELHEREPALAANQLGALFFPDTAHVSDLDAMSSRLLQHFLAMGGRLQTHCRILGGQITDSGIILASEQGEIRAARVVIAAGAFAKPLVKNLTGIRVALDTERGYHLMLPSETQRLSIPVSSADRRFIMTPMTGGLRLAGTVEYAGLSAPPNMARAHNLLPLAQGMFHAPLDATAASPWMGCRPTTSDSLPVIDRQGSVYLAFGHQHLGLTQAAITAEAMAALFFERPPPLNLAPFALQRFA
ncbi:MAG: FAD-dependent oxidoreductase [Cardiobacteriaceae bacterium]|nr:FAD-dependent oxidoreductase [Cardiobacteriaceae bacterium]